MCAGNVQKRFLGLHSILLRDKPKHLNYTEILKVNESDAFFSYFICDEPQQL